MTNRTATIQVGLDQLVKLEHQNVQFQHLAVMAKPIQVLGTSLTVEMGNFVWALPAVNVPQGGFFVRPVIEYWPNGNRVDGEESIHASSAEVLPITLPQMLAIQRIQARYERPAILSIEPMFYGEGALVVKLDNISLAVETDGHTHS